MQGYGWESSRPTTIKGYLDSGLTESIFIFLMRAFIEIHSNKDIYSKDWLYRKNGSSQQVSLAHFGGIAPKGKAC